VRVQRVLEGLFSTSSLDCADSRDAFAESDPIDVAKSWNAVEILAVNPSGELCLTTSLEGEESVRFGISAGEGGAWETAGRDTMPTITEAAIAASETDVIGILEMEAARLKLQI
jgi:hypothetical protein